MSLNIVLNNQPTRPIAQQLDAIPGQLNQPHVGQLPGSNGTPSSTRVTNQLNEGNPGGVGAPSGLGIQVDVGA